VTGETASLTITVANTLQFATYGIAIRGVTKGGLTRSTTILLSVVPNASITVGTANNFEAINAGETLYKPVVIGRNSYAGPVALTLPNIPPGVTAIITPTTITGVEEALLSVAVGSTVQPGTYQLDITGTAPGLSNATFPLSFRVPQTPLTPPPVAPNDFEVFPSNFEEFAVAPGGTLSTLVILNRHQGIDPVTLSLIGAPPGITGTFTPQTITEPRGGVRHGLLQITVSSNVAPGSYPLQVRGSAPGHTSSNALLLGVHTDAAFQLVPLASSVDVALPTRPFASNLVSINRTNFIRKLVRVTAESVPAGMRVNTLPADVDAGAVDVIVEVANNVPPGTYTITIRATAPGQAGQTASFQVVVTSGTQ
jgi:hypothetical protein